MPDRRAAVATVFLDRDGVINAKAPEGEYVRTWEEFRLLPGAAEAIAELTRAGRRVVVVSNQRGIALGRMTPEALEDIHARLRSAVADSGGRIDAIYHCPHDKGECECRKPRPGMFLAAARDLPGVVLEHSAVVGDRASDMQAATAIGALRVHVAGFAEPLPEVDYQAADLADAVRWLLPARSTATAVASRG